MVKVLFPPQADWAFLSFFRKLRNPTIQKILSILSKKTDVLSSDLSISLAHLEMYTM
jgi:hypothetical protein